MTCTVKGLSLALAMVMSASTVTAAQEAAASPSIGLELNGIEQVESGCRMTFVVANRLGSDIAKAAYEIALFDEEGLVDRLMVLDFQALPDGKTKVRQFDLADTECAEIGRVLINDATACEGDGIEPGACIANLITETRTDAEFGA